MKLKDEELQYVIGGAISATFLNAVARIGEFIFEIGRNIGKNLRRLIFNQYFYGQFKVEMHKT